MDIDDKESAGKLEGDVASGRTHTQEADSLCGDPDNVGDIQSDVSFDIEYQIFRFAAAHFG